MHSCGGCSGSGRSCQPGTAGKLQSQLTQGWQSLIANGNHALSGLWPSNGEFRIISPCRFRVITLGNVIAQAPHHR
jgi:hypothetical protein